MMFIKKDVPIDILETNLDHEEYLLCLEMWNYNGIHRDGEVIWESYANT